ncbi:chitinase [Streptomyces sp. NPDC057910]|uniref:chitinase n=1 Tax=Streptomyces sp. NPDC057910 TaxID=3346278 RepID=UPI0036E173E8
MKYGVWRTAAGLATVMVLGAGTANAAVADRPGSGPAVVVTDSGKIATDNVPDTAESGHTATRAALLLSESSPAAEPPHVVAFYQSDTTTGDGTPYVSPLSLAGNADVVEVGAFHLNNPERYPILTLNSDIPSAPKYAPMWRDIAALQAKGVKVTALLGGAAHGTYALLDADFDRYYQPLHDAIAAHNLHGIDLDIEEQFTEATAEKLITRLRADFGRDFLITLAPVPGDLTRPAGSSLPDVDYPTLEAHVGFKINWYVAQFYCGNGTLATTAGYDAIIKNHFPASKLIAGAITWSTRDCGGYVNMPTLQKTLSTLATRYPGFAGVAGWEYAPSTDVSAPGCPTGPADWYCAARQALPATRMSP